jgi:1-acyl-sn-glycerol-3-phosphate acyltransferase
MLDEADQEPASRESPRRPRRIRTRHPLLLGKRSAPGEPLLGGAWQKRRIMRRIRAVRRGVTVLFWTLPCMLVQALCLLVPGRPKVLFPRFYWATMCRLIGMHVRVVGHLPRGEAGRPVIYVSNHCSWLDVLVLGGRLPGCFVSKDDVDRWPVINSIARLGRTVFVSRNRGATVRERDSMRARLDAGDNLILFPEGTSSDGSRVLPFRSSFFAVAEGDHPPLIQPVSVVYDRLGGLPTGRATRPLFAWYGDMNLASHFWRLAQHRGMRATVLLHTPIDPAHFANRKALAHAVWHVVADGASTLRQNRPATPIAVDAAAEADASQPAYA